MAFSNITGTSEVHFRISLGGPTVYFGDPEPSGTPPTSLDSLALNPGDLYVRTDAASPGLYTLGNGGDSDWNEILVSGGPIVVGGNLSVGGVIDQNGPIITLNAGLAGIPPPGAGMEIGRGGDNVFWVWDDLNQWWKPHSATPTSSLHNVYVENFFRVDGSIRVPTGTVIAPAIYFGGDANTGIFLPAAGEIGFTSGSTERWRIDGSGNFAPGATNTYDIGSSSLVPANVYGTNHLGSFGSSVAPSYTFNTETDLGFYRAAAGSIGLAGSAGTVIATFDTNAGEVTFQNVTGADAFSVGGIGDIFIRAETTSAGNSSGIEMRGPGGVADNWKIGLDSSSSSRLDIEYNSTDLIHVLTSGQIQTLDGTAAAPVYSFTSDTGIGMFSDGAGAVSISTNGLERFRVNTDGSVEATTALYEGLVTTDNILTNKKYVDNLFGSGGSSWREPVVVKDDTTYANLAAAEAAMNLGTVDGYSVSTGDRILYTDITGESKNVFIINGAIGGATLVEDVNNTSVGDAVYIGNGTFSHTVYAFDITAEWTEISGSGGGGTLFFNYEAQTAIAAQKIFALSTSYAPTANGSRLLVYVNGVKQEGNGAAYTETDSTTVTFSVAPGVGKRVEFYSVGTVTQNGVLNRETQTGISGTPVINFGSITYVLGQDGLLVYLNGQKMIVGTDYTETSSTSITWIGPALVALDVLEFYSSVPIVAGTNLEDINNVNSTPPAIGNDGDVLTWNNSTGKWEPQVIPIGLLFDELVDDGLALGSGPTVFDTTNATVAAKTGTTSFQQVFVNGILQKEGVGFSYTVSGVNQITFAADVPAGADVTVYQL